MATQVAELLASLRLDNAGFTGPVNDSAAALTSFGNTVSGQSSILSSMGDSLVSVSTVLTGAFAGGLAAAASMTKQFGDLIVGAQIAFTGFGESSAGAAANIMQVLNAADQLGVSQSALLKTSETLQILTSGAENNTKTLTAFAGAAATTQIPIQQLTTQLGYLYQAFAQGDPSVGFMGRVAVREGLIPQAALDQAQAMAKAGQNINDIWAVLMDHLAGGAAAAQQQANTMKGLTTSIENLLSQGVGSAFAPLYEGVRQVEEAFKGLLMSPGVQQFATQLATQMDNILPKLTSFADSISSIGSGISGSSLKGLVDDLTKLEPLIGTIAGIGAGGALGALSGLSLIGQAIAPLASVLGPAVTGLLGFLAASQQTRDALGNLVGAVGNLLSALSPVGVAFVGLLGAAVPVAATVINMAAAVVNFVASSRPLLDLLVGIAGAFVAFQVWEKASAIFEGIRVAMIGSETAIGTLRIAMAALAVAEEDEVFAVEGATEIRLHATDAYAAQAAAAEMLAGAESGVVVAEEGVAAASTAALGPVGAFIGVVTALALAYDHLSQSQKAVSDPTKESTATLNLFNTQEPSSNSDVAQMNERVNQAQEQKKRIQAQNADMAQSIKDDQNQLNSLMNQSQRSPAQDSQIGVFQKEIAQMKAQLGAGNQDISGFQGVIDSTNQSISTMNKNISDVAAVTGKTLPEVAAKAQQLGTDLTLDPGSVRGKENIDALIAAFNGLGNAATTAGSSVNQQIEALKAQVTAFDNLTKSLTGAGGASTFTIPTGIAGADPQLAAVEGQTFQTKAYADAQLKAYETMIRTENQSYQLAQAIDTQSDAQTKLNQANDTQTNAASNLNDVLAGETVKYAGLQTTLELLIPSQAGLGAIVAAQVSAVQQLQNTYDGLNKTYTALSNQIQILTDQEKAYQDIINRPLAGQQDMTQAQHDNKMQQATIQSEIDTLELAGVPTMDQRVVLLTEELDLLKKKSDLLTQQNDLTIGDQQFQIQQAQQGALTTTFDNALAAAEAIGKLKDQTSLLQQQSDTLKPSLDAAKDSLDNQDKIVAQAVTALQALASSDSNVTSAQDSLATSIHGVQTAHEAMTQQVLSDNAALTASILQYITESKQIPQQMITDLQAGVNINIAPAIADLEQLQHYTGLIGSKGGFAAGGITQGPVLAGEGNPAYAEFVVPTDPMHRSNALALYGQLGGQLGLPGFAEGGVVGGHFDNFSANVTTAWSDTGKAAESMTETALSAWVDKLDAKVKAEIGSGSMAGYINPFLVGKWALGRTDQGVDYIPLAPSPVEAIGPGVVTYSNSNDSGWPGGAFISYMLTQGALAGAHIYVAEHLQGLASVGTKLTAGQQIATALPGYPWTEWGFAGLGDTPAVRGGGATAGGMDFARFLMELGASVQQNPGAGPDNPFGILSSPSAAAGGGSAAGNASLGQQMAAMRGWVGGLWDDFNNLEMREAGWNNFARNPTSGAYGIAQALPESKYPFAGTAAGGSDPRTQIQWMDDYIVGRYGNPHAAWLHEQAYSWYDAGGVVPPGLSLMYNGTGTNEQLSVQPPMVGGLRGAGGGVVIEAGAVQVTVNVPPGLSIPPELTNEIETCVTEALENVMAAYTSHRTQ